jgi:hypothetical protein
MTQDRNAGSYDPTDEVWDSAGVPNTGFWDDETIMRADKLVSGFLKSSFERADRDGLSAEHRTEKTALSAPVDYIAVSDPHWEVPPIKYDNRHLTAMATDNAIEIARGENPW